MIYSLRGELLLAEPGGVVVECAGVGYRCAVSLNTLTKMPCTGSEVLLLTHMVVRDDTVDLFGFADAQELASFRLLTTVNGVGARLALTLLSDFSSSQLALAVASGDAKALTRSVGVGNKLAQRIVLELKDKLGGFGSADTKVLEAVSASTTKGGNLSEAIAALAALGYSQSEAAGALADCTDEMSVETLVKRGLKKLARF
ncbi:Holliday junction branch migration protein RuvA [Oscillospiraceae bacterium LTW-04]|nr:Holliday junction branch migration protein RuvA [Oscillospiraceae bacterium MB24-C1]